MLLPKIIKLTILVLIFTLVCLIVIFTPSINSVFRYKSFFDSISSENQIIIKKYFNNAPEKGGARGFKIAFFKPYLILLSPQNLRIYKLSGDVVSIYFDLCNSEGYKLGKTISPEKYVYSNISDLIELSQNGSYVELEYAENNPKIVKRVYLYNYPSYMFIVDSKVSGKWICN